MYNIWVSKHSDFKLESNKTKFENYWLRRPLELPSFITQKTAAPQNGVEFHKKSIAVVRYSLALSYNHHSFAVKVK